MNYNDFSSAIKVVLAHEGGYNEDHAGATNYGITLRSLDIDIDLDGDIDADDIRAMTEADAISFYKRRWWDRYQYHQIKNLNIATKIFDLAVNMGAKQAAKNAQRALRSCGHVNIKDDGVLGPKSFHAINMHLDNYNFTKENEFLAAIRSEAAGFYRGLVIKNPAFKKYLNGWLNRAYS